MTSSPTPAVLPDARARHLASRSSFSRTASRMNLARPYVPTNASIAASISADMRIGVGFMSSGGRPIGRAVATGADAGKKTIPFSVDAINDTDYINGIVYGGKAMQTFTISGGILDSSSGIVAVAPPVVRVDEEAPSSARARRDAQFDQLASALNAAAALLEKLEDNPTLFFGMEDTCYDEFDDLRTALGKLS